MEQVQSIDYQEFAELYAEGRIVTINTPNDQQHFPDDLLQKKAIFVTLSRLSSDHILLSQHFKLNPDFNSLNTGRIQGQGKRYSKMSDVNWLYEEVITSGLGKKSTVTIRNTDGSLSEVGVLRRSEKLSGEPVLRAPQITTADGTTPAP